MVSIASAGHFYQSSFEMNCGVISRGVLLGLSCYRKKMEATYLNICGHGVEKREHAGRRIPLGKRSVLWPCPMGVMWFYIVCFGTTDLV